ncbi:MAG: hypothetical protein Q7U71_08690 [bacterium]|nr:hypothetical protein [bacterium]
MAGKACLACLRAWQKPEFRQARQQGEAQRPESFQRRAFFFLVLFLSWRHKKEKEHSGNRSTYLTAPLFYLYFSGASNKNHFVVFNVVA